MLSGLNYSIRYTSNYYRRSIDYLHWRFDRCGFSRNELWEGKNSSPYRSIRNGKQWYNQVRTISKLALNIVRDIAPDKSVMFDEYHHGYNVKFQGGMVGYFSGTPVMWMFVQLMLLALIIVYTNGRRLALFDSAETGRSRQFIGIRWVDGASAGDWANI